MKNVPRPKTPKFIPDPFSEAEIRSLQKACKELSEKISIRATAIIMVLLDSGMRLGEPVDMRMTNLDLEHGRVKNFGKGSKERFVYFKKISQASLLPLHQPGATRPRDGE